jgi:hypothetical protein
MAWRQRNIVQANTAMIKHWLQLFKDCPSQGCVLPEVVTVTANNKGGKMAADLWESTHRSEVEKRRSQAKVARQQVLCSLYPSEDDRVRAVRRMMTARPVAGQAPTPYEAYLLQLAREWSQDHKAQYTAELTRWETQNWQQFLYLFGSSSALATVPMNEGICLSPEVWDLDLSNTSLTFSNGNTSVKRPGSASSYPAAFAPLPDAHACLTVVIDECNDGPNWLTFGIATSAFAAGNKSGSDGIGRSRETWGICDERDSRRTEAVVAADRTTVGSCRKFQEGDRLTAVVNVTEGWCEVSINNGADFMHRFDIPAGTKEDYVFAMTFANNHQVTIVPTDAIASTASGASLVAPGKQLAGQIHLSAEHTAMHRGMKRMLSSLYTADNSKRAKASTTSSAPVSRPSESELSVMASRWLELSGGSDEAALTNFQLMKPTIESLLSRPSTTASSAQPAGGSDPYEIEVELQSAVSDRYVSVKGKGSHVNRARLSGCSFNNRDKNRWRLVPINHEGVYAIVHSETGRLLTIEGFMEGGSRDNGKSLALDDARSRESLADRNYHWKIFSVDNVNFEFQSVKSGQFINVMSTSGHGGSAGGSAKSDGHGPKLQVWGRKFGGSNGSNRLRIRAIQANAEMFVANPEKNSASIVTIASPLHEAGPSEAGAGPATGIKPTWKNVAAAVAYFYTAKDRIAKASYRDDADIFLALHGEGAAFVAAGTLAPGQPGSSPSAEEKRLALAYMQIYPDETNAWYDYNRSCGDPMFGLERAPGSCRCLPRHISVCPALASSSER